MTVLQLQERGRPILKLVNDTICKRVKAKRHVFVEQPSGSSWLDEPELEGVRALIQSGDLIVIKAHGCQLGYEDVDSGLPHFKPSTYVTSMIAAESLFQDSSCDGSHQHQHLEGANSQGQRTAQASVWPDKLNKRVLETIVQQAAIEQATHEQAQDVFPAEVRRLPQVGKSPKRRRKGRVTTLTSQYGGAPPVYLRPSEPLQPAIQDGDPFAEVPPDEDDADVRARQASQLEPLLHRAETQRREEWLKIDPDIRKILRTLHVNFGHPTNITLQRILRRQGAKPEAVAGAELLSCDACGESIRRRRPNPVRLPNKYVFNNHLLVDVFYGKDIENESFCFLNVIDDATGFQVVSCLGTVRGPPASKAVLRHFLTSWTSWAGLPQSIQADLGKEFMADFTAYMKQFGVETENMPLEAPWKSGKVERAGGLWKDILLRTVHEMQLRGLDDMILATSIITQCRNSFPRSNGYSPNQWVLGQPEIRLPGSLLSDEESQRLEILEAAEDPKSAMAKTLSIREAAKVAQIRLDTESRVRRALLHQSTPTRGPFPVGSYVYFLRLQMPKASRRNYKWFGPARVIGCELRSPTRLQDDEELPTDGGQPRSYWLRYGSSVVLVTGEQLRFASEDELIAAHTIPQEVLEPEYARGARNFVDLRGPLAVPAQPEDQGPLALPAPTTGPPVLPFPATADEPQSPGYSPSEFAPDAEGDQPMQPTPTVNDEVPQVPADPPDQTMGQDDQEQQPAHGRQMSTISGAPEPEPQPVNTPTGQAQLGLGLQPVPVPFLAPQTGNLQTALRDPDRLDGYRAVQRQHGQQPQRPYFVEDDDFECETMPSVLKSKRLEKMLNYEDEVFSPSQSEEEQEQCFVEVSQGPGDVFLTGKAVRSEISLKDLSPEDRAKYDVSMAKEWSSWQKFNAVEVLSPQQIEDLPEDAKIIGTRWVHTDKNQKKRLMSAALQGRTGKSQAQIQKEFPLEAKSRLVVQGHQETDTGIRSDSPTASLLAFNLVCAVAVIQKWIVMACDASTAYLQSNGISRLLLLRPPRPPPPGILPHDLLRALGSIYGTKDAGRAWWKKLYKTLRYYNWIMSRLEHALFFLVVDGKLCGILITHVDDLFCAGEGKQFHDSIEAMQKDIYLKINKGKFRFCGKNVFQRDDFSIEVDQYDAIEAIDYMVFAADRRKMVNSPLTEAEQSLFRGLIGQMGWVTRQSRPDLMVNVSVAAQSMSSPKVKDVINLNKAVKALKESYEAKWNFIYNDEMTLENCCVFVFADSSFANGENLKSQCGFITGLSVSALKDGSSCPIMILETYSGSIKRVCRSTLAAESNGFLNGVEAGDYLRTLLMEITHPGEFTDAKSLEQTLNRDAGQPTDKRVRILVSQVKELIGENTYEDDSDAFAIWTDTSQMLADVLTKLGCERESLLHALECGRWQLEPTEQAKLRKVEIRAGRHARKAAKKAASISNPVVAEDGCETETYKHAT